MTGPWPPSSSSHFGVPRRCRKSLNTVHKGHWFQEHSAWKAQPLPLRFDYGKNGVRQLGGDGSECWKGSKGTHAGRSPHSKTPDLTGVNLTPALIPLSEMTHRALGQQCQLHPRPARERGWACLLSWTLSPKAADVIQLSVLTRDWGNRVLSLWSLGHDMLLPPGVDKR